MRHRIFETRGHVPDGSDAVLLTFGGHDVVTSERRGRRNFVRVDLRLLVFHLAVLILVIPPVLLSNSVSGPFSATSNRLLFVGKRGDELATEARSLLLDAHDALPVRTIVHGQRTWKEFIISVLLTRP
jgi:hypothetical protein